MGSNLFAMTPIEGAIWHMGVMAQSYLGVELFGSNVFTLVAVAGLTLAFFRMMMGISEGHSPEIAARRFIVHLGMMGLGLMFLRTMNTQPFTPSDSDGKAWADYEFVRMSPQFKALKRSTDGLYWYTLFHKGAIEVTNVMTAAVNSVFRDRIYPKSSNMVFKMLVNTANIALDDPEITEGLEVLASKCSDALDAKVLTKGDSLKILFDLETPECQTKYNSLQSSLRLWVKKRYPDYLSKLQEIPASDLSSDIATVNERTTLENKIIASAIINYAKSKGPHKDGLNTNTTALTLNDKSEQFWFNVQRVVSNGSGASAIARLFTDRDVDATLIRNEAGIIYNNLLNLMPVIRGYIKAFLALAFLLAAAGLALGQTKPMIWWFTLLALEMLYTPLSALNYELCSTFMMNSGVLSGFGDLKNDPMVLAGASLIDDQLIRVQTAYFLTQVVIVSMFGFGIIRSGFAVKQLGFSQGSGFTGFVSSASHNRVLGAIGQGVSRGMTHIARKVRS